MGLLIFVLFKRIVKKQVWNQLSYLLRYKDSDSLILVILCKGIKRNNLKQVSIIFHERKHIGICIRYIFNCQNSMTKTPGMLYTTTSIIISLIELQHFLLLLE